MAVRSFAHTYVGQEFQSDAAIYAVIDELRQQHKEIFLELDYKPKTALQSSSRISANPNVTRYLWHFGCAYGPMRRIESVGLNRACTIKKVDCPCRLIFRLSPDGTFYTLSNEITDHKVHNLQMTSANVPLPENL
ncbi:hypothetical protein TKK_0002646 [Trichogramma kaykai]|uniref:Uncharacterized protein n=1 Tax=Trichogramma kaykai TaxID=54128 RepID=A0ABD2XQN5_9HYME